MYGSQAAISGTVGQSLSYPLSGALSFSTTPTQYTATNLPAGLSINSISGNITGTGTLAGTHQVAVYGGNANGYGDYQTLTVSIANAGAPAVEGLRWAKRFVGSGNGIYEIDHAGGWYVGGSYWNDGASLNLYRTQDGINWQKVKVADNQQLVDLAQSGNTWLALTNNGSVFRSVNSGGNWTLAGTVPGIGSNGTSVDNYNTSSIVYNNGTWVFITDKTAYRSSNNGTTWSSNATGSDMALRDLGVGNGVLVAVGEGGEIRTSSNAGQTWTKRASGTDLTLNSAAFGNGRFVVVGSSGVVLTSSDNGTTWALQASGSSNYLASVSFGNNVFVRSDGYVSADGTVWSAPQAGWGSTNYDDGVVYGNAGWLMGGWTVYQSVAGDVPNGWTMYGSQAAISGTIGQPLSYNLSGALSFSTTPTQYTTTNLPAGLSINPNTGFISGIVNDPPILVVKSKGVVSWAEQAAFEDSLTASGGSAPYTWKISEGSLPSGLTLNQAGVISGIPSIGGISNFTVRVMDAKGSFAEGSLRIRIIPRVSSGGGYFFRNLAGTLFGTFLGSGDQSSFTGSAHGSGGFSGSADGTGGFSFAGSGVDSPVAFNSPAGIAVDGAGNIFVSDSRNHAIRKVFTDGRVENFVGSFSGSSDESLGGSFTGSGTRDDWGLQAEFSNPQGLASDSFGNIFVAESGSHRIRKVSPFGQVSHYVGGINFSGSADGSPANARFNRPSDVAVDSVGNIYVADSGNHAIRRIAANGTVSTWAGTMGQQGDLNASGNSARFQSPQGIAVDVSGNVYVADTGNCLIRKIAPNRTVTILAGAAFTGSAGACGRASFTGSAHAAFLGSADANFPQSLDGNLSTARFSFPTDIEVDAAGNLYVTDSGTSKVRKVSANGTVTTLGNTPEGFFYNPLDIAVSSSGQIYIADAGNNRIAMSFIPAPEISVELPGGILIESQAAAAAFSASLLQSATTSRTYTIRNVGYIDLTGLALSKNGTNAAEFMLGALGTTSLGAGNSTTFTVSFSPTSAGNRTAQIAVASNDGDENPFVINLAGYGLGTLDFDGDGVSDAAEYQMSSLGFNWQTAQADMASAFLAGVNAGGLYNTSQIQGMNIGTPLISKNATSGHFELTIGLQKSTNLQTFQHFSLNSTETTIEPDGRLKIRFSAPENAAFFRLKAQ